MNTSDNCCGSRVIPWGIRFTGLEQDIEDNWTSINEIRTAIANMSVGGVPGPAGPAGPAGAPGAEGPIGPAGSDSGTIAGIRDFSYVIYINGGNTLARSGVTGGVSYSSMDSALVMQMAIDATPGGGAIHIAAGTYTMLRPLTTTDVSIVGDGDSTILQENNNGESSIIEVYNSTMKIVIANMLLDGRKSARSSGSELEGVEVRESFNVTISGLTIQNFRKCGGGIYTAKAHHCVFENNHIRNIGDPDLANYGSGITLAEGGIAAYATPGNYDIVIRNNWIQNCSMTSIDIEPGYNIEICGNILDTPSVYLTGRTQGITLVPITGLPKIRNVNIHHNKMEGAFSTFVNLQMAGDGTICDYITIADNYADYGTSVAMIDVPIYCNSAQNVTVVRNTLLSFNKTAIGLMNCQKCIISDNAIINTNSTFSYYGIQIVASAGTSLFNVARGNYVEKFQYGICANSGSNNTIVTLNMFNGCSIATLMTGSNIIRSGNMLNGGTEESY